MSSIRHFVLRERVQSHNSIIITSLFLYTKNVPIAIHGLIFKFIALYEESHKCSAVKPKRAANMIFARLTRERGLNDIIFCLKETTRNSTKKIYKYHGVRQKLDKPVPVKLSNDKVITYTHANKVELCE